MALRVSVVKSTLRDSPDKYRPVLHPGSRRKYDQFLTYCEKTSTYSRADIEGAMTCILDWIKNCVQDGRECDLGILGRSRLGLKGLLDDFPERLDDHDLTLTLSWVFPGAVQKFVSDAGRAQPIEKIVSATQEPLIHTVRCFLSRTHKWTNDVWQAGALLHVRGHKMKFNEDNGDEGLFLIPESRKSGKDKGVRLEVYQDVFDRNIRAQIPAAAAGLGDAFIELRRRVVTVNRFMYVRYSIPLKEVRES